MGQDFHEAFGLGVSDKLIDTIDPDGVALAAIQRLNEVVQEQGERLANKNAEIATLQASHASMQSELSALKEQVAALVAINMR